jgi:uncharacterized protein involved in exopolysaccharide biosynthesis
MADKQERAQETSIRDFANVIFRRKWMILAIVVVTTVFVVYLKASQPQSFYASARVLVKRGERSSIYQGSARYLTWAEEVSSQIEVILSEPVFVRARKIFADSVAARGLPETLRFNAGAVRADVVGESNVFLIGYGSFDPNECVVGCIAATEAFKQYYREQSAPPAVRDYFDTGIELALVELERWRVKKSKFLEENDYLGLDEESRHQMQRLSHIEMNLAECNADLSEQGSVVESLRDLVEMTPHDLENNLAIGQISDVSTLIMSNIKSTLQKLRLDRQTLLNKYTDRHPDVLAIDQQIGALQQDLVEEVRNAYEIELAKYNQIMARKKSLMTQKREREARIDAIPEKEVALARIENEIQSHQLKYELLLEKQNEAEIKLASNREWEITVLTPATRAWAQRTRDYVRIALGPFLSLVVALGIAFFFESLDHSVKNVAEVEQYLKKKVLATFVEARK